MTVIITAGGNTSKPNKAEKPASEAKETASKKAKK